MSSAICIRKEEGEAIALFGGKRISRLDFQTPQERLDSVRPGMDKEDSRLAKHLDLIPRSAVIKQALL